MAEKWLFSSQIARVCLWTSIKCDLADLMMWHSKWMMTRCSRDKVLASSLINRKMTKIGQAAWLCGSLPLGCMITYLEKFLLILYLFDADPIRVAVADPNRRWYTFDTLKRNEWSVMCGPGCKMFLLNPVYSSLEIHYRKVDPYLVKLESNLQ